MTVTQSPPGSSTSGSSTSGSSTSGSSTSPETSAQDLERQIHALGRAAQKASRELALLSTERKNEALLSMADALEAARADILDANQLDVRAGQESGLSEAMVDRLRLTGDRLAGVAAAVRQVAALGDPVGEILREWQPPNGLVLQKKRTPIGVIGIIYESRPNVTVDAATLCFKAGNAVVLRGGSEAIHSNRALARALHAGLASAGLSGDCIGLVPSTDRQGVRFMAEMDDCLDLIIPRGGHQLIETVVSLARMPVLKHYNGVCHVYVDKEADLDMAAAISINSKCQRPGVCNAMETLLVHRDVAERFLPAHTQALREAGVELRGDEGSLELVRDLMLASEEDWYEEYLALVLSIRIVDSLDQAIEHITKYGSRHTDAIVTDDRATAERFLAAVDSSTVLWNASTRFADGGEFGFGAEIGISTDKLHARGPMALEELTTYKYVARGTGQTR